MHAPNYLPASRATAAAVAGFVALGVAACHDFGPSTPEATTEALTASQQILELTRTELDRALPERSTPRLYFDINETVPGFAGLYLDGDQRPVILMTSAARAEEARSAVGPMLEERGLSNADVRFQDADFEWRELLRWRLQLRDAFANDGVVSLGIDESRNRIRIGVLDDAAQRAVGDLFASYDIPSEAVEFEIRERRTSRFSGAGRVGDGATRDVSPASTTTLADHVRPLLGGLRINDGGVWQCTYGAGVDGFPQPMFVTASHCAFDEGAVTTPPFEFFQPERGKTADKIPAWESLDPDSIVTGDGCTSLNPCRFADATLAEMDLSAPESSNWAFGEIARPASGSQSGGSLSIAGTFYISDRLDSPIYGQVLHKVGGTTGWSFGTVKETCSDETNGSGFKLFCQARVAAGASGGDSGAPVFDRFSTDYVKLAGILWGGENGDFWFSPMSNLDEHFGLPIDVAGFTAPPPPSVSISGPTLIEPDATCTWTAQVSTGQSPFTYDWTNHQQPVSGDEEYTGGKLPGHTSSSFTLTVEVEDNTGQTGSDQIVVTEDASAPPCTI
ncbi:MAG: hypothetical protein EA351_01435 [Gemmatimonadales bacterium]|nr:MAG: hypothetical protein EA351_01435 [Gemmatimonadales bacterium]